MAVKQRDFSFLATISGELELCGVDAFEQLLGRAGSVDVQDVVLDLRDVSFLDASGVRMLLEAQRRAREQRQRLRIVRGGHPVQRVLRVTGMDSVLPMVDDVPDLPA